MIDTNLAKISPWWSRRSCRHSVRTRTGNIERPRKSGPEKKDVLPRVGGRIEGPTLSTRSNSARKTACLLESWLPMTAWMCGSRAIITSSACDARPAHDQGPCDEPDERVRARTRALRVGRSHNTEVLGGDALQACRGDGAGPKDHLARPRVEELFRIRLPRRTSHQQSALSF